MAARRNPLDVGHLRKAVREIPANTQFGSAEGKGSRHWGRALTC